MPYSIRKYLIKCKFQAKALGRREDLYVIALIVLVGFGGFGLGRLSVERQKTPVEIVHTGSSRALVNGGENINNERGEPLLPATDGNYVASVSGSKYHFPWCSSAQRIKEGNKVWFATKEDAEKAGYTPASNCKGL